MAGSSIPDVSTVMTIIDTHHLEADTNFNIKCFTGRIKAVKYTVYITSIRSNLKLKVDSNNGRVALRDYSRRAPR